VGFPSQRGEILLRERSSPMGETRRRSLRDFREARHGHRLKISHPPQPQPASSRSRSVEASEREPPGQRL
jgi:hypothetical protein